MILPSKHIKMSESIFGLSACILKIIKDSSKTTEQIWVEFSKINNSKELPSYHGFDNLILALDYLYLIGVIDINSKEKIYAIN